MTVNEYEVVVKVTLRDERGASMEPSTITKTEFAYSPIDACTQAMVNLSYEVGGAERVEKHEIVRVQPPERLIQMTKAGDAVRGLLASAGLLGGGKKP